MVGSVSRPAAELERTIEVVLLTPSGEEELQWAAAFAAVGRRG